MTPDPSLINLPHAGTIVGRLQIYIADRDDQSEFGRPELRDLLEEMEELLLPIAQDPPEAKAVALAERVAALARQLVDGIVDAGYHGDRLGQCVRNLFECLGLPSEGAALSLDCGERPDSPLRP